MSTKKPWPPIGSRFELAKLIQHAQGVWKGCRPGQALSNQYELPPVLDAKIYTLESHGDVVKAVMDYCHFGRME